MCSINLPLKRKRIKKSGTTPCACGDIQCNKIQKALGIFVQQSCSYSRPCVVIKSYQKKRFLRYIITHFKMIKWRRKQKYLSEMKLPLYLRFNELHYHIAFLNAIKCSHEYTKIPSTISITIAKKFKMYRKRFVIKTNKVIVVPRITAQEAWRVT